MSVNIFGFRTVGQKGENGKDGLSIKWFPNSLARMFGENCICSYFFNTLTDGVVKKAGAVIALKNRTGTIPATVVRNYRGLEKQETGNYALLLENSLFEVKNVDIFAEQSLCCICFTFKIEYEAELVKSRFVFSNKNGTRAVSIRKDRVEVWSGDLLQPAIQLEIEYREWNTVFIQFSHWSEYKRDSFAVVNGGKSKGFDTVGSQTTEDSLYIGGKPTGDDYAEGWIGSFQVYRKIRDEGEDILPIVPEQIYRAVIIWAQDRVVKDDQKNRI